MSEHVQGKPVSAHTYKNHKCRCDDCRKAWARYMRPRINEWRKRRRQKAALANTDED